MTGTTLAIKTVTLTVNDLDRVSAFYQRAVGLHLLAADATSTRLGTSDTVLLELRQNRAARRWQTTDLGLYHTAFLLPTRGDLGRWLNHAIASNLTIRGSDHRVTEAIYLTDPEGNGVELYADRPRSTWQWTNGTVDMTIDPLDLDAIRDSAFPGQWQGVPDGTVVGHLNLNVGSLPEADAFYANVLGFDITCRLPGASFFASGGYHHHLATNTWRTAGLPGRTEPVTGLAGIELVAQSPSVLDAVRSRVPASAATLDQPSVLTVLDPWGLPVSVVTGQHDRR
jgi:catechol 2,3-dioxygenase